MAINSQSLVLILTIMKKASGGVPFQLLSIPVASDERKVHKHSSKLRNSNRVLGFFYDMGRFHQSSRITFCHTYLIRIV